MKSAFDFIPYDALRGQTTDLHSIEMSAEGRGKAVASDTPIG